MRGLTVSTPVIPKDLTVSATMPLLGADGIRAARSRLELPTPGGVFQAPEADTVGTGADAGDISSQSSTCAMFAKRK